MTANCQTTDRCQEIHLSRSLRLESLSFASLLPIRLRQLLLGTPRTEKKFQQFSKKRKVIPRAKICKCICPKVTSFIPLPTFSSINKISYTAIEYKQEFRYQITHIYAQIHNAVVDLTYITYFGKYSVSQKNIPNVFSCNFRKHCRIFIMFGTHVTEKVSNQQLL